VREQGPPYGNAYGYYGRGDEFGEDSSDSEGEFVQDPIVDPFAPTDDTIVNPLEPEVDPVFDPIVDPIVDPVVEDELSPVDEFDSGVVEPIDDGLIDAGPELPLLNSSSPTALSSS